MEDPQSYLVEPSEPDASISHGFVNPIDFFNYVSPTAWANELINTFLHVDLLGWCMDCIAGDWEALWKFGDAVGNLAQAMQALGMNIQEAELRVDQSWHGNAADSAFNYFSNLAAATSGQQFAMQNAEEGYHKAATAAWQLANQLGNIVQAIVDELIIAGIAGAAGTVTAETGVGAVVGYGLAAIQVTRALKLLNKASMIINNAGTVVIGGFAGVLEAGAQANHLSDVPLPAAAFSAPGA
jgi:hypothetical protein